MFGENMDIDLGDYPLGWTEPQEESYSWNIPQRKATVYQYQFENYEALATSDVFQKALNQALVHKDREIEMLRKEIMEQLYERE